MSKQRVKYFAYGSNMDVDQLKKRCPSAEKLGTGVLTGYRLGFTNCSEKRGGGTADIVADTGHQVWGVVFKLTAEDHCRLDCYEGSNYRRCSVPIQGFGNICSYEVKNKKCFVAPTRKYLCQLLKAARKYDFPHDYVKGLRQTSTAPRVSG